jgi:hypothetical protein
MDLTPADVATPQAAPEPSQPAVPEPSEPEPKQEDLDALTVSKLVALAKRRGVPLRSGMRKREIIEAIRAKSR